jgi:acyl-CoA synthetase (AMP-forming)/AMP-acid ligase II
VASARQVFLTALLQARERREAAGVAAAAAAFAALGDGEMADRGFEIATATAIERGDTAARERVSSTPYTTEGILLDGKERLADFKVPARIEFRESLPKSPAGKILRGQL